MLVIRSRWWLLLVITHLRSLLVGAWLLAIWTLGRVLALRGIVGILRRIGTSLWGIVTALSLWRGSAVAGVGSLGRLRLAIWGWILLAGHCV